MKNIFVSLLCLVSAFWVVVAGQTAAESGTATYREWIQGNHSLDYPNHGCEDYADILTSVQNSGGGVIPLANDRFFMTWFPENWDTLPDKRLIVTLHGNGGCAEKLFQFWQKPAMRQNYAIAALQYAAEDASGNFVFDDSVRIYEHLRVMLDTLNTHFSLEDVPIILHGFSRGSARTFELAMLDRADDGMQAFSAFISDSGTVFPENAGQLSALLQQADPDTYRGAHFWLYCGGQDHGGQTCRGMNKIQQFVLAHAGVLDDFYQHPTGGHGIFITNTPQGPGPALTALFEYIDALKE
jgi:hypothetical protein